MGERLFCSRAPNALVVRPKSTKAMLVRIELVWLQYSCFLVSDGRWTLYLTFRRCAQENSVPGILSRTIAPICLSVCHGGWQGLCSSSYTYWCAIIINPVTLHDFWQPCRGHFPRPALHIKSVMFTLLMYHEQSLRLWRRKRIMRRNSY